VAHASERTIIPIAGRSLIPAPAYQDPVAGDAKFPQAYILPAVNSEISSAQPVWPDRIVAAFDALDSKATNLLSRLNQEQLNWKPSPGDWSIGQCLEHLCVTNDLYLSAIASALVNRPASPVDDIQPDRLGRWFINSYVEPSSRSKRARAPKKIVPAEQIDLSVLDRFLRSNQSARELVRQAQNFDVNRIRFKNPIIPYFPLRFTVGTGIEIVAGHERRHLLQGERLKSSVSFPA
jgi:hypothetical protein